MIKEIKNNIYLSIIIPTKNEELYLEKLLLNLLSQNINCNYEIIVADSFSKDKTRLIAKKYNCIIVDGGLPAFGRNKGAQIAKGKYLLFLDADVLLEKESIDKWIKQIVKNNADIILPYAKLRNDEKSFLADFYFRFSLLSYNISNSIFGSCFFIKKSLFEKVGGFDESIYLLEDIDLLKRVKKIGKKINIFPFVQNSGRRLNRYGEFKIIFFMTYCYFLTMFGKKITYNKIYSNIYKI